MLRSNDGGLTLCYALRRLANNIQEPFRTLYLNAIDASIKWWNGKLAPRATALRAPWSLTPNLQLHLKQFLRKWHLQVLAHQVPCHTPSFKMVFIKHAAVLDQLCNHKQAIVDWSTSQPAVCCCKTAALNPSDPHWVLAGSLLHSLVSEELLVIAEGSLLNKVFPSKKISQPASTGPSVLDQAQWSTFHAKFRDLRPLPKPLDRTFETGHLPHHQILHQSIPKNLRRCHLPLRRQTIFITAHLLPVPLLPIHRTNISRPFHFRTGTSRPNFHCLIAC